jgi:hypothetical protein
LCVISFIVGKKRKERRRRGRGGKEKKREEREWREMEEREKHRVGERRGGCVEVISYSIYHTSDTAIHGR